MLRKPSIVPNTLPSSDDTTHHLPDDPHSAKSAVIMPSDAGSCSSWISSRNPPNCKADGPTSG